MRSIPELVFYLDDSAEYAARMDKILSDLAIPPATDDDDESDPSDNNQDEDDEKP